MMLRPMPVICFKNVKLRIVFPPALSSAFFSNDTTHLCCFNIFVFLKVGDLIHRHFQSISSLASSSWCLPINSWLLEDSNFSVSLSLQYNFNNIMSYCSINYLPAYNIFERVRLALHIYDRCFGC